MKISSIELEELLCQWAGIDMDNDDDYETKIDEYLDSEFSIDTTVFTQIVNKLFEKLTIGISPLTNMPSVGITSADNRNLWIFRTQLNQSDFIASVLTFITDGTPPKPEEAFQKDITAGGKLEYRIYTAGAKVKMIRSDKKPEQE